MEYYKEDIADIDQMIAYLRDHKKNLKRMDTLRSKECHTPKQFQKREADMNWLAMENIKVKHFVHALAVNLEYADERPSYKDMELNPSGWHRYRFSPPMPRRFVPSENPDHLEIHPTGRK